MEEFECEITKNVSDGYTSSFGLRIVSGGEEFLFPDLCTDREKLTILSDALDECPKREILLELFDDFLYS